MKKITVLMLFAAAGLAQASPADELLSAQAAFRQALSAQNSTGSEIAGLQSNLAAARARAQRRKPMWPATRASCKRPLPPKRKTMPLCKRPASGSMPLGTPRAAPALPSEPRRML